MAESGAGDQDILVDICIPTWRSGAVLEGTLRALARSVAASPVTVRSLIVVDDESDDDTVPLARRYADEFDWPLTLAVGDYPLQVARAEAIERTETDWILFLDDDVRIREDYLSGLVDAIAPLVGGIQGRKGDGGENAKWVRWRSHRAGTHATLVRREAVASISFPDDLTMLEDEYIRQTVEERGYLWLFNHQVRFDHANQDRHPNGWREGYLAGKYGLGTFCLFARKVPAAVLARKSPVQHVRRTAGYVAGWSSSTFSDGE